MAKASDIPTYITTYPIWGGCKMNYAVKKERGINPRLTQFNIYTAIWERISPFGVNHCVGRIALNFSAN